MSDPETADAPHGRPRAHARPPASVLGAVVFVLGLVAFFCGLVTVLALLAR
jgi:hypothetical protein